MAEHTDTAQAQADALKRAALAMAIEHHDNASRHPRSRGAASPTTVTSTAREFEAFLREVGDRAAENTKAPDQTAGG